MNKAKRIYKDIVAENIPVKVSFTERLSFTYTLFPKTKRRMDLTNSLSAIQKFTDDALVELGVIPDDDYKIVSHVEYLFGEIDKENPRAELVIKPAPEMQGGTL